MRSFSHDPINFRMMPPAIKALIIANTAIFVVSQVVGPEFTRIFGLVPDRVISDFWVWQPFTYLFIHGGFFHLLFNLFALWMFGMPVEAQWGGREFLKYYLICGLGAAAAQIALDPHSSVPIIGASGSVYGMLVAFAMLYPDAVVYLYFLFPIKAKHMAMLVGVMEFALADSSRGVARFAHLGGMVTGYLFIRWWWVVNVRLKGAWKDIRESGRASRVACSSPRRDPSPRSRPEPQGDDSMAEVDRILDKILVSGLDSLSDTERAIMRRYSDKTKK